MVRETTSSAAHMPRVAAAVLKALSTRRDIEPTRLEPDAHWRGRVDAQAVRARFSDATIHARLLHDAGIHGPILDLFEQVRAEANIPQAWAGARTNVAEFAQFTLSQLVRENAVSSRAAGILTALRLALDAPVWTAGECDVDATTSQLMASFVERRSDQSAFGLRALDLIAGLGEPRAASPWPTAQQTEAARPRASEHRIERDDDDAAHVSALRAARAVPRGKVVPCESKAPAGTPPYHAYTSMHDCEVDAAGLCDLRRRSELARQLRQFQRESPRDIARWAHRLQRYLQARQMRRWRFDLEEGVLDSSRLARLVADPTQSFIFKEEAAADFPQAFVAVLVDISGSMRGEPIAMAASCAQILGSVLERCGVGTEILGFTTRKWRGGASRSAWINAARPSHPGRLADLLHVIFKTAEQPWRRAKRDIATMLDTQLLKENVDGEALLWALRRLSRRSETRKILMVISDGAPMDESTLAENDRGYLDRHLRSVIRDIERVAAVDLFAIGIDHDVGAYYSNAFTLSRPENLGEAMVAGLIDCLCRDGHRPTRGRARVGRRHRSRKQETGNGQAPGDVAAARFRAQLDRS